MRLVQKLRSRRRDMRILSSIIESSLMRSAAAGEKLTGAHQLALSAFEMEDGLAEQALAQLGSSGAEFAAAVKSVDAETLASLGLEIPETAAAPVPRSRSGKTDATFEAAVKGLYDFHNARDDYRTLTSAHVLAGVASVEHGVSARVFSALGLDRNDVIRACTTA